MNEREEADLWKQADAIFEKADGVFRDADRFFQKIPQGETILKRDGKILKIWHWIKRTV